MNSYRKPESASKKSISVGDVVIIKDDEPVPRCQWRLGKVAQLAKGRDGQTRGVKLKAISKKGLTTSLFRPVQRLIPFGIVKTDNGTVETDSDRVELPSERKHTETNEVEAEDGKNEPRASTRPVRKAAVEGQNLRRLCDLYHYN